MFLNTRQLRETVPMGSFNDISLDKAELVAIFLEAFIYGVEALTFVATVYLLHGTKHTKLMMLKFGFVIIMFLLNTIHIGSSLRRILNAFVGTPTDPVPDAEAYLADLAGFLYRFMNILTVIQFIILDILVVYRCYTIWDKKIVVTIVPAVGVTAFLITGIAAIHAFATDTTDTVFTGITRTWFSAMLCITLFTKLVCFATVVAGTYMPRPMSPWHSVYLRANCHPHLYKALLVGIESGGLAVLGAVILIPVYLAGRNAQGIMLAAMSPLTGQSFLLIVIAGLLGFTPSATGVSRRRKIVGIPANRISIPPISISPVPSPTSRFSTGSLFKSKIPSFPFPSAPPSLDYNAKPFTLKTAAGVVAPAPTPAPAPPAKSTFTVSHARGYGREGAMPFSNIVPRAHSSSLDTNSRETLPYGADGDSLHISVSSRQEVNTILSSERAAEAGAGKGAEHGASPLGRSADGVVVLQKEYVS